MVAENTPLATLHRIFQVVMGWEDSHLHAFRIGEATYGDARAAQGSDWIKSESGVTVCQIASDVKTKFQYEYDFGDGWEHDVQIEKISEAAPETTYPLCTAGKRACPPEDCGGPGGYDELMLNPSEWPDDIDSESFDLNAINDALRQL